MSGGEQQQVAVAIAIANEPAVLLADEPTESLDRENAERVLHILDHVRKALGVTIVIVTHDRSMAMAVDRYVEIRDGKTSREAVRRSDDLYLAGPHASEEPESHEHYALLDSAGRMQIPQEMRDTYGMVRRVRLVDEGGRIVILPPQDGAPNGS